jgi:hypothetical protein
MKALDRYFTNVERSPALYNISSYLSRDPILTDIFTRLGLPDDDPGWPCPPNLSGRQKIFASQNMNGEMPFLRLITPSQLFDRACNPYFGSVSEAVRVARSLTNTDVELSSQILNLDNALIVQVDAIPMTNLSTAILDRLFADIEYSRPSSVWDLALAASASDIEPQALSPVLDLLQHFGGDVARCHEFLGFCTES